MANLSLALLILRKKFCCYSKKVFVSLEEVLGILLARQVCIPPFPFNTQKLLDNDTTDAATYIRICYSVMVNKVAKMKAQNCWDFGIENQTLLPVG
jgi:hypothetical protein